MSTINCESCEPSPATAALGGVPPAPSRTLYLQHLDLSDCTRLLDAGLRLIVKNSPHIQHLYLRRCVNLTGEIFVIKSTSEIYERLFLGVLVSVYFFSVHKLIFEFFPTQKMKIYYISHRTCRYVRLNASNVPHCRYPSTSPLMG